MRRLATRSGSPAMTDANRKLSPGPAVIVGSDGQRQTTHSYGRVMQETE